MIRGIILVRGGTGFLRKYGYLHNREYGEQPYPCLIG